MFGNLEEKFLAERKIKLQHYFNTILGSKDFSKLNSLKNWIDDLINNHYKNNKTLNKSENEKKRSKDNLPNLKKSIGNGQDNNSSSKIVSSPKNNTGKFYLFFII